ncbi:MAG: futalosine hydrolase [Phycisphaeraceae bacterium]|nr:futalosine hydrolase [Phycisphaeraceae bacterium]MCW5769220.1 futalosine hydrolase [Phycisphaeraceae bacterium]
MVDHPPNNRILVVVASEIEARAVAQGLGIENWGEPWRTHPITNLADLLLTGVGKSNAAGAVARAIDRSRYAALLSIGIAGTPEPESLPLSASIAVESATLADEGIETESGFLTLSDMGFPPLPGVLDTFPADPRFFSALSRITDSAAHLATVSTCSGTDARAARVRARIAGSPRAEDMETASIALVCARLRLPWGGIRIISNTTGNREQQKWDLKAALERLSALIGPAIDAGSNALTSS